MIDGRKSKGLWLAGPRQKCRGRVFVHGGMAGYGVYQTVEIRFDLFSTIYSLELVKIDNFKAGFLQIDNFVTSYYTIFCATV